MVLNGLDDHAVKNVLMKNLELPINIGINP